MFKKLLLLAALLPATAFADPQGYSNVYTSYTVGTTSQKLVKAYVANKFLDIVNNSTTATIYCNFGSDALADGSSSLSIPPLWHRSYEGGVTPYDALYCISSAASTPVSIGVK